jgi:hypothetical protein
MYRSLLGLFKKLSISRIYSVGGRGRITGELERIWKEEQ